MISSLYFKMMYVFITLANRRVSSPKKQEFFFFWTTGCLGLLIYGLKYYSNTYCLIQEIWNVPLAQQRTEGTDTSPHTEKLYFQKVSSFFYLRQFVFLLTPQTRPEIHEHTQQRYEGEALSPRTCRVINLKVSIRGPAMCCALLAPRRRRCACVGYADGKVFTHDMFIPAQARHSLNY